jgi:hypothetical protein
MKVVTVSLVVLSAFVFACGGGDEGGGGGDGKGSSPSSPSGSNNGSSGGSSNASNSSDAKPTCGSATCDASTEFCELTPGKDSWEPRACKKLPQGTPMPKPASQCAPPSEEDCMSDPSKCQSQPDTSECDGSKTCAFLAKQPACPSSGTIVTKC